MFSVFYDNFVRICNERGISTTDVRKSLSISQSTMASWKSRNLTPQYGTVKKIADYLGVDWTDLVPEEKQKDMVVTHIKSKIAKNASWIEFLSYYSQKGYEFTPEENRLVTAFNNMNSDGQGLALTTVEVMSKNPRFSLNQEGEDNAVDPQEDH